MNPTSTVAAFYDQNAGFESPPVIPVWSAGNTVLTCTPWPAFANNHIIDWEVFGLDATGNPLAGATTGSFTNVAGVNGGSGTNAYTFFQVVHYTFYYQSSASPPVLFPNITYEFFAQTLLASNRTATNITVTIPVRLAVSNLVEELLTPERFSVAVFDTNILRTFTTNFPSGNYIFNVSAVDLKPAGDGEPAGLRAAELAPGEQLRRRAVRQSVAALHPELDYVHQRPEHGLDTL